MAQAITDENFGAWLLKCNPKVWGLQAFLDDGNDWIDNWSVQDNYRSERMAPNDPVVLWVTGSKGSTPEPGIWGVGRVTDYLDIEASTPGIDGSEDGDTGYWLDEDAYAQARFFIPLGLGVLETPIPRDLVLSTPGLAGMEVFRAPQNGNPNWLTADEWSIISNLLGEQAIEPLRDGEISASEQRPQAQDTDPLIRLAVELAAVEAVISTLEGDGWKILDLQAEKVGWDLTATRADEVRHVEIKGRGTSRRIVNVTANELRAAAQDPDWVLAVVTSALKKPELTWHRASTVVALALPITYRVELAEGEEFHRLP
ncbi:protein NO VEIN domain-containing protein [Jatrophihabitans sp. DSM 45814]